MQTAGAVGCGTVLRQLVGQIVPSSAATVEFELEFL